MKVWTLALLLCACGGFSDKSVHPPGPVGTSAGVDAGSPAEKPAKPPKADMLNDAECEALFNHIFELAFAAQKNQLPPEEQPTAADVETAKTRMRGELLPECAARTREELKYDCIMKTTNRAEFQACYPAHETNPPSSEP